MEALAIVASSHISCGVGMCKVLIQLRDTTGENGHSYEALRITRLHVRLLVPWVHKVKLKILSCNYVQPK